MLLDISHRLDLDFFLFCCLFAAGNKIDDDGVADWKTKTMIQNVLKGSIELKVTLELSSISVYSSL